MSKGMINIDEIDYVAFGHGSGAPGMEDAPVEYTAKIGAISRQIGAQKLGYNITILPPGKRGYPLHAHRVNEEMFFILSGCGKLRRGSETVDVRPGDVIACPPGGPETAHQLINTGDEELRYLAVSTKLSPEIVHYPDSGKLAIAEFSDGKPSFRVMMRPEGSLGYWDGE